MVVFEGYKFPRKLENREKTVLHSRPATRPNSTRDEKVETNRIEQVLVNNSSLVSGLSEASGVKVSWVEVSQESPTKIEKKTGEILPIKGL